MAKYRFGPRPENDDEASEAMERELFREECERRRDICQPHIRLKALRKSYKLSQEEMAEVLQVSRRTLQDFERGKRAIPSDAVARLYGRFNCDLHALFVGQPYPISREDRASFVKAGLDAVFELMRKFPDMSAEDVRHYATLTAELTDPGEDPELGWLLEMVGRRRAEAEGLL
ncbi:helix-turn-helix transcriptional regulator [Salipiger abyssi]|uniref:helix-turn-helix transcriptional regulator n=1 Tax=Salipiger abyssi TaxID=1250539 RepID=UPI001A8DD0FE|nr:helix-turn-helix transcriptional regulator [Salipiger abyssi]MBN9888965.1 helix-turn-helix transcriptional regulator [Salipiger abyssi]